LAFLFWAEVMLQSLGHRLGGVYRDDGNVVISDARSLMDAELITPQ